MRISDWSSDVCSSDLEAIAEDIRRDHGVEVRTLSLDLNQPDAAQRMAAAAEGLEVGLYVANAGSESGGHGFLDTQIETIRELIARNVLTTTEDLHIFARPMRSKEHTYEIQSLMRISYADYCLIKKIME